MCRKKIVDLFERKLHQRVGKKTLNMHTYIIYIGNIGKIVILDAHVR